MQYFIFLLFIISCFAEEKPPIPNSYLAPTVRAVQLRQVSEKCSDDDTDKGQWKCADCRTAQLCGETEEPTMKITCADQFPGRPYCNNSATEISEKCVNDAKVCNQDTNSFDCPGIGSFPSLVNCKEYYFCKAKGAEAKKYICANRAVYNHTAKACKTGSACYTVTVDCAKKFKVIPYRLDPSLYVTCRGDKAPVLGQCENNLGYDPNLLKCDFICEEEGKFLDESDTTKQSYYQCTLNGKVLEKEKLKCEDGEVFDPEFKNCMDGEAATTSTPEVTSEEEA